MDPAETNSFAAPSANCNCQAHWARWGALAGASQAKTRWRMAAPHELTETFMKIAKIEDLHCDAGGATFRF